MAEKVQFDPSRGNELYEKYAESWQRAVDFAELDLDEMKETYLFQHSREASESHIWLWRARKQLLHPRGITTKLGLSVRLSYLFDRMPRRSGALMERDYIQAFVTDCTGGGKSLDDFMRDVLAAAVTTGLADVLVDPTPPESLEGGEFRSEAERRARTRPYISLFTQLDRTSWLMGYDGNYSMVRYLERGYGAADESLFDNEPQSAPSSVLTFLRHSWARHTKTGTGKEAVWVMDGPHPTMGAIPVVQLVNQWSAKPSEAGIAKSDLMAVAALDQRMLNLASEMDGAELFVRNVLTWPGSKTDVPPPDEFGRGMVLVYPEDARGLPAVLNWPTEEIRIRLDMLRDIERKAMALLKFTFRLGNPDEPSGTSGRHEILQRTELYKELGAWSNKLEGCEKQIIAWVESYVQGRMVRPDELDYSVNYNDDFILEGPDELLEYSKTVLDYLKPVSPTFAKDWMLRTMEGLMGTGHPNAEAWQAEVEQYTEEHMGGTAKEEPEAHPMRFPNVEQMKELMAAED